MASRFNDLAGFSQVGSIAPELLLGGELPLHTDAVPSGVAALEKYEVAAKVGGQIVTFDPATHKPDQLVVVAQPITAVGMATPYFDTGHFNHAALKWPASLDTYAKRRDFQAAGSMLKFGNILPC